MAVLTGTAALVGFFFNAPAAPAQTTVVTGGHASAYAAQASLLGMQILPPTPNPNPNVTVDTPDCPKQEQAALLDVLDTGSVQIGAVSAEARCNQMGTPTSFFEAEADVASVNVFQNVTVPGVGGLPDTVIPVELLDIGAVHTECRADVNDVTATVTVVSIEGPGGQNVAPIGEVNAQDVITVPGVATITLHEDIVNTPDSVVVNGVHVVLLPQQLNVAGVPVPVPVPAADIILGHVECSRVLGEVATTTTSTTLPGATTTSQPGATTTTTRPTAPTQPGATTTTTQPIIVLPVTPAVAAVPVAAAAPTTVRPVNQLARTGADVRRAVVWGVVAIVLGLIMTMGNGGLSETTLAGAASYGPTSFPESKRRRRRPRAATRGTLDSAALDALIEMDGGDKGDAKDNQ